MNSSKPGISVLMVDDHPIVRDGYRRLLGSMPDIGDIREAADGEAALETYRQSRPDVVIMDLTMPGMGGMEAIRRLREFDAEARILVFSMHDSDALIDRCIEMGVQGYLIKSSGQDQLVDAVRQIAAGKPYMDSSQAMRMAVRRRDAIGEPTAALTSREFQIFAMLAEGMSVQQIAHALGISPSTVGVHRNNLLKKTGLANDNQLVRLAIRLKIIEA